jgi:hypothetical protein
MTKLTPRRRSATRRSARNQWRAEGEWRREAGDVKPTEPDDERRGQGPPIQRIHIDGKLRCAPATPA